MVVAGVAASEARPVALITGASSGIGAALAHVFAQGGHEVVLAARRTPQLAEIAARIRTAGHRAPHIVPVDLARADAAEFLAQELSALKLEPAFLINNAGYGHFGFIEEITEDEARAQIETNVFGALWVTQAALPFLRAQRSGHILQVSSIGGISAFPNVGMYHASKWALEGFSQSLAQEVAPFGIKVTLIEPGGFETDWAGPSSKRSAPLPDLQALHDEAEQARKQRIGKRGDPKASATAVLKVVDAPEPPLRVFFGAAPLQVAKADYENRLKTWEEWQPVAVEAQG